MKAPERSGAFFVPPGRRTTEGTRFIASTASGTTPHTSPYVPTDITIDSVKSHSPGYCGSPSRRNAAPTSDSTYIPVGAAPFQGVESSAEQCDFKEAMWWQFRTYGDVCGVVPDAADAIYRVPTVDVSLSLVLVHIFRNESLYPAERRWHKKSAAPQPRFFI